MASEVDICNMALRRIGAERISSLADTTKRAKLCNEAYALVRDRMLESHPWNFALKRVELAATVNTPEFGFDKEFQLPNDFLRFVEYEDYEKYQLDFTIEDDKLLCNEVSLKILYLTQETNTTKYSPGFVAALALELSVELAYTLVQSNTLKSEIKDEARRSLANARLYDAQGNSPKRFLTNEWTDLRHQQ